MTDPFAIVFSGFDNQVPVLLSYAMVDAFCMRCQIGGDLPHPWGDFGTISQFGRALISPFPDRGECAFADAFADVVAKTVEKRTLLLKLLSMNMYDMEEHSRLERLIEFKAAYGVSMDTLEKGLEKFFPASTTEKRKDFIWHFFPFMFGIYPYTFVTDKQKAAMEQAGTRILHRSVYELTRGMIAELLKSI